MHIELNCKYNRKGLTCVSAGNYLPGHAKTGRSYSMDVSNNFVIIPSNS